MAPHAQGARLKGWQARPSFAAVLEQLHAFHLAKFGCTFEQKARQSFSAPRQSFSAPASGACVLL